MDPSQSLAAPLFFSVALWMMTKRLCGIACSDSWIKRDVSVSTGRCPPPCPRLRAFVSRYVYSMTSHVSS